MPAGAFGKLGAKLVDDFGASADEAARIINNLDADTVRALDENPQFLDEIGDLRVQTDEGGGIASRFRNIGSSGDETGGSVLRGSGDDVGLVPQSKLGRVGAGVAGVGLGYQGLKTLGKARRLALQQAEIRYSQSRSRRARFAKLLVRNEEFDSQEKARVISDLAGSGFVRSSISGTRGAGSGSNSGGSNGGGGGLIPDDPVTIVIAVIVLVFVLKYALNDSNGGD
ncbi:MAG: hypothetical protein U5J64_11145 [Halobacteriales archaeon]|nr:hypothetical protein [Halobacteriales archaeon]